MLARIDRKKFFASLKPILGVKRWTKQQVDGLDRFLDECQRDPIVPDGLVGIQRVAYWIYTMAVETDRTFQPIQEYGGRAYFIRRYGASTRKGRELGNKTDEEAVEHSGKGLVQTTGTKNVERLEAHIREHYPWIVEAVERDTGRPFDLTYGDQPDDKADAQNLLRFDVAYVALVAGTTFAFYGPPLSRYISAKGCNYKGARRCVNGTDRDDEFAVFCPRIEAALRAATAPVAQQVKAVAPAVEEPVSDIPEAAAVAVTPAAGLTAAVSAEPATPVEGGAATDEARKVTAGSGSWIRSVMTWIGGLFAAASEHAEKALGLSPDAQKYLIVAVIFVGGLYMVLKAVAEWQVRRIAASPALQNVK